MAELVKVQGSQSTCLKVLQAYADQYKVKYIASFRSVPGSFDVIPSDFLYKKEIRINFMWNHSYTEYDNGSF